VSRVAEVKPVKILKSPRKRKDKIYYHRYITIPAALARKLEEEGVDEIIITMNDLFIGIPPHILDRNEDELAVEVLKLIRALRLLRESRGEGSVV